MSVHSRGNFWSKAKHYYDKTVDAKSAGGVALKFWDASYGYPVEATIEMHINIYTKQAHIGTTTNATIQLERQPYTSNVKVHNKYMSVRNMSPRSRL